METRWTLHTVTNHCSAVPLRGVRLDNLRYREITCHRRFARYRAFRIILVNTEKASNPPARVEGALKIGTVARQLGISPSMIRAWEKLGLTNPRRTGSSYRMYTSDDIRVLRRAVYLRRVLGLNAPAILKQLRDEGLLNHNHAPRAQDGIDQPLVGPRLRKLRMDRGESL